MKFTPVSFGYLVKPLDFLTLMEIKDMSEGQQAVRTLAACLVNEEGHNLFADHLEVNAQFRPREILQLFQDVVGLMGQEYDFSDPLSKQGSTTQTGNGFPYSVSGKPL